MSSKSNYLEFNILNHILTNVAFTSPTTTYVGLMTAMADPEDSSFTEVTGGSYAREAIAWKAQTPTGSIENNGAITFTQATANWGTVIGFGVFDAVSAGNLLYWGFLGNTPINFATSGSSDTGFAPAHGMADDDDVRVEATPGGSLPSGLSAGTTYFIVSSSVDTVEFAASQAGATIDIGAGSGVVIPLVTRTIQTDDTAEFADGAIDVVEA